MLDRNHSLEVLNVANCNLSGESFAAFLGGLTKNRGLVRSVLNANNTATATTTTINRRCIVLSNSSDGSDTD